MNLIPASPAPEIIGIHSWVNSEPLEIKKLKGKVVLLDCFTYSCIFCLRSLPVMVELKEKYGAYGLEVVAAHSSEYEFAKDPENIKKALKRYDVKIPVALDINNKTWESYGNMYWPKHILIDANGFIRYEHAGFGMVEDFDEYILELLQESGAKFPTIKQQGKIASEIFDTYGMHFAGMSPEICVGYTRLRRFGNNQTPKPDEVNHFTDSGKHMDNMVYLRGKWVWKSEGVQYPGESDSAIMMRYTATRAHGIIGTSNGKPALAEIKIDGNYLTKENAGKDITLRDGKSILDVKWPFMHNLVATKNIEQHEIEIIPKTDNFVFFTFVFG